MAHKKIAKTHGPLVVDEITGAVRAELGSDSAAAYAAGLRLAETGGTIAFAALPQNADTITIGGAAEAINHTYTFLDALLGAANEVHIETSRDATMANLVAAINVNAPDTTVLDPVQGVTATLVVVAGPDNDTLTLAPSLRGSTGNLTVAESTAGARITVVSLTGGADFNNTVQLAIETAVEAVQAAMEAASGADLTITPVPINTAGTQQLLAKTASQTQRLHALSITLDGLGTVEIQDKDGGTLAGPWTFGLGGGIDIYRGDSGKCAIQQTAVNKGLQIVATGGNCKGEASVSTGV